MKIISIQGFESHLFKEGNDLIVNFKNRTSSRVNRNYRYDRKFNSHSISLRIDAVKTVVEEKKQILDQKYDDLYREDKSYKILPFQDKKAVFVKDDKEHTHFQHNYGLVDGNELFLELDNIAFQDKPNLNLKEFVSLTEEEVENYIYPLRFNDTSFHRRGGKIDIFNVINNITFSTFGVDKIRGFRGYATTHGMNALKENIKIESYYNKKSVKSFPFEDSILEGYLYNSNAKKIIDSITFDYDPITKVTSNVSAKLKQVNKISTEPRFVSFEAQKIIPFNDIDPYKNNTTVQNDSQIYFNRLSDSELNNILLESKKSYDHNVVEEERLYTSLGKSVDYTLNAGIESLVFHESVD